MATFLKGVFVLFFQVAFALIIAFVGYHSLDTFALGFGDWFAIGFIGIMIVRTGYFLEKLDDDLTKRL